MTSFKNDTEISETIFDDLLVFISIQETRDLNRQNSNLFLGPTED